MSKTRNYSAFYVSEPFNESALGAHATKDFVFYNLFRAWRKKDSSFPFLDAHETTYNVRDGSDWEKTLKPRLRKRLNNSKNIILFLSDYTKSSRALREELDYAINVLGLPVIVVYPEFDSKESLLNQNGTDLKKSIKDLWDKVPVFRDSKHLVPVLHVPMSKPLIKSALLDSNFMFNSKGNSGDFFYKK